MNYFNLRGHNDSTYPALAMRFSADRVVAGSRAFSLSDLIINVNGAVAAPGYKDQAASFLPGQEIHFYAIGGAAVSPNGVSSLSPPSIGPSFSALAGYDSFCYLTTVRVTASGLLPVWVRDRQVFFENISYYPVFLLKSDFSTGLGHATIWTGLDVSPCIPAISLTYQMFVDAQIQSAGGTPQGNLLLNLNTAQNLDPNECYANISCSVAPQGTSSFDADDYTEEFPTPAADGSGKLWLYYKWCDIARGDQIIGRYFSAYMRGYTVPS